MNEKKNEIEINYSLNIFQWWFVQSFTSLVISRSTVSCNRFKVNVQYWIQQKTNELVIFTISISMIVSMIISLIVTRAITAMSWIKINLITFTLSLKTIWTMMKKCHWSIANHDKYSFTTVPVHRSYYFDWSQNFFNRATNESSLLTDFRTYFLVCTVLVKSETFSNSIELNQSIG